MADRSSMGGLFQPMALSEVSAPARGRPRTGAGPSSHQDRQMQPIPAYGSVVL